MNSHRSLVLNSWIIIFSMVIAASLSSVAGAKPLRAAGGAANGNKHDFSVGSGAPISSSSETRVCIFCHTPHGASAQSTLWNRPAPVGAGAFNLNASGTLVIKGTAKGLSGYDNTDITAYPNGATRLCMSCHDGVVAIGTVLTGFIAGGDTIRTALVHGVNPNMRIDLATSHPVSFKYDAAVVTEINNVKGAGKYGLPVLTDVPLDGGSRMQCTTCHDPHEDTRDRSLLLADQQPPFWRHVVVGFPNSSYDQVCNTCHIGEVVPAIGVNH